MDKKLKRIEYKKIREKLSYDDFSLKITELTEYKKAKTVFIYVSFSSEPKTDKLISEALKTKRVLVPYCVDGDGNMVACEIKKLSDLTVKRFGIKEPMNPVAYEDDIDFSVIPGLAFSKSGYRIGYGKGYYDRFLEKHPTFKVGLAFDELLFDEIPFDEFDNKVNLIITPGKELKII